RDAERDRVRGQLLQVTADRLLTLVDAEHRLEGRVGRLVVRPAVVQGQGVEGLRGGAPLVGQMKDAPPLDGRERLDLLGEAGPRGRAAAPQVLRRPAQDLCELKYQKGALLDTGRRRRPQALAQGLAQLAQRAGVAQRLAGGVGQRQAVQYQANG